MSGYISQKPYKIDAKGRISIPAEMRLGLGEEFIASLGSGESLSLYTMADWDAFMEQIDNIADVDEREMLQFYYRANAVKLSFDGQGRLLMNENLRKRAKLSDQKEAIVFGNGKHIEIWNVDKFNEKYNAISLSDVRSILTKNQIRP